MCHINIWPKFNTLKNAPTPVELMPSLAWVEIHCESKLDWLTYPVKAAPIEVRNVTTPVIQVMARPPRHAAMKYLPHRCTTMAKKKISTLQRCSEFTKSPTEEECHHWGPRIASRQPVAMTTVSAAKVVTPKT